MAASQKSIYDFGAAGPDFETIDGTPVRISKEPATGWRHLFSDSPQRIVVTAGDVEDSVVIGRGSRLGRQTYGTPENAERLAELVATVSHAAKGEHCSSFGVKIGRKVKEELGFMPRSIFPLPYGVWRSLTEHGPMERSQEDEEVLRYSISEYVETRIKGY